MASVSHYTSRFIDALLAVDRVAAQDTLNAAFENARLDEVVSTLVAPALEKIGDEWGTGRVSLSEIYMNSKICEELMRSMVQLEGLVHLFEEVFQEIRPLAFILRPASSRARHVQSLGKCDQIGSRIRRFDYH